MIISRITTHILRAPIPERTFYSSQAAFPERNSLLVKIEADNGLVGWGEGGQYGPPGPVASCINDVLAPLLLRRRADQPTKTWEQLYAFASDFGRQSAYVEAISAIDIALWDICGKARGVPCWQLFGDAARERLTPYASLQPEVSSFDAYVESMTAWASRARQMGFRAAKLEATFSGPYAHKGLSGPDEWITEVVRSVRSAAGPDMTLMVDVQYAFDSVERALRCAEALAGLDVFFLETPLWVDDLAGHAELARRSPVRIASGEWLSTRHDFADLIVRGGVHVAQPDIGRVGGLTEARRVCDLAAAHDRLVVPHAWKTGISVAVAAHLAMVTPHMPFFEFLPAQLCESRLRQELVTDELVYADGELPIPARPGLGVELNRDALEEFARAAAQIRG
jgi:L-alanine-DL-glutamate epimerase-like enolase superfamily enzyme